MPLPSYRVGQRGKRYSLVTRLIGLGVVRSVAVGHTAGVSDPRFDLELTEEQTRQLLEMEKREPDTSAQRRRLDELEQMSQGPAESDVVRGRRR